MVVGTEVENAMQRRLATLTLPWTWAVNLVLPPECAWCLEPIADDQRLCSACTRVFEVARSCCHRCAMPLPEVVDQSDCIRCRDQGWQFERVIALGPYQGRLREAIILMKKPAFEPLANAAGELLAVKLLGAWQELQGAHQRQSATVSDQLPEVIIPVPNHWTRRLAHRTSAAESLAMAVADTLRRPLRAGAVRRLRATRKQGMLAWSNRQANVRQAFRVTQPRQVAGKHVLLVDDVFTSGATAAELTRCLLRAGASRISVAVAARGTGTRDQPSLPIATTEQPANATT